MFSDTCLSTSSPSREYKEENQNPNPVSQGYQTFRNGLLHSFDDEPASVGPYGEQLWYRDGVIHRSDDKPAYKFQNLQVWFCNGLVHRADDKPAIVFTDRFSVWYRDGIIHRDHDKPAVMLSDNTCYWYRDGQKYIL